MLVIKLRRPLGLFGSLLTRLFGFGPVKMPALNPPPSDCANTNTNTTDTLCSDDTHPHRSSCLYCGRVRASSVTPAPASEKPATSAPPPSTSAPVKRGAKPRPTSSTRPTKRRR